MPVKTNLMTGLEANCLATTSGDRRTMIYAVTIEGHFANIKSI